MSSPAAQYRDAPRYLILDARYEKGARSRVIVSQAVLVGVAVDEDGWRKPA